MAPTDPVTGPSAARPLTIHPRRVPAPRRSGEVLRPVAAPTPWAPVVTAAARLLMRYDGHAAALRNAQAAVHADVQRAAERADAERSLAARR